MPKYSARYVSYGDLCGKEMRIIEATDLETARGLAREKEVDFEDTGSIVLVGVSLATEEEMKEMEEDEDDTEEF